MNPYSSSNITTETTEIVSNSQKWRLAGRLTTLAVAAFYLWNAIGVCFYPEALRQNLLPVALMGIVGTTGVAVTSISSVIRGT